MTISSKKAPRRLGDVLPAAIGEVQANFCRNPACQNFAVAPRLSVQRTQNATEAEKVGRYRLFNSSGDTVLRCSICGRTISLLSNEGLIAELTRLRTANGVLAPEACRTTTCENHWRPVYAHPDEHYGHDRTPFGAVRKRCKRCRSTLTLGNHYRAKTAGSVNKDIVKDLVNRGALNAILRKVGITPMALYDRIAFIHAQMIAIEVFKLTKLRRATGPHRTHFALATDAQDYQAKRASRHRRLSIKLSAISTADKFTGFIFRTDVNFDPTVGDVIEHFRALLDCNDFAVACGLGLSHRYALPSFLKAVGFALWARAAKGPDPTDEHLTRALQALRPEIERDDASLQTNPICGAIVKNSYTAIAHFMLIGEVLPADAELHLMADPDGHFVIAEPVGFAVPLRENRTDLSFIMFNKSLTTPKKQALVGAYQRRLAEFASSCNPTDDATEIRCAFIERFATRLGLGFAGVQANWWTVPVETMYEPERKVGIAYQRPIGSAEDMSKHRLELLDRASLHAVDSFFNFNLLRQRVSYFHRAGMSRSSGSHYNAFQPYRPDMVQKIVDIARVYFNWVEPRPLRLARKFDALQPTAFQSGHDHLDSVHSESTRRRRREAFSTPAMRLGLAKSPVRLETILYTDWRSRLYGSGRRTPAKTTAHSRRRRLRRVRSEAVNLQLVGPPVA